MDADNPEQPMNEQVKQQQIIEWLELLLAYAKGEKKWDTGGPFVDEENILMPFGQGYWFDVKGSGPGMPPFVPNAGTTN